MLSAEQRAELRAWLAERKAIHELFQAWPPGTKVTSHEDAPLMVPAPGITGHVVSWFEDGTVGVLAPMAETTTSPLTGITVEGGDYVKGQCEPGRLVLLEYGDITPEDVAALLGGRDGDR